MCVKGGWDLVGALTLMLSLLGEHTFAHIANPVLMVSFFLFDTGFGYWYRLYSVEISYAIQNTYDGTVYWLWPIYGRCVFIFYCR